MPYASGENPKVGDVVKNGSGRVGSVFELDLRKNEKPDQEKIRVRFDDGQSTVEFAGQFELVQRVSE